MKVKRITRSAARPVPAQPSARLRHAQRLNASTITTPGSEGKTLRWTDHVVAWSTLATLIATSAFSLYQARTLEASIDLQRKAQIDQRLAIEAQIWLAIEHEAGELNRAKLANPETLPYLEGGADERMLKGQENGLQGSVQMVLEMHLDFFDSLGSNHLKSVRDLEDGGKERVLWERWIGDTFRNSPAMCRRYYELREFYTPYLTTFSDVNCIK